MKQYSIEELCHSKGWFYGEPNTLLISIFKDINRIFIKYYQDNIFICLYEINKKWYKQSYSFGQMNIIMKDIKFKKSLSENHFNKESHSAHNLLIKHNEIALNLFNQYHFDPIQTSKIKEDFIFIQENILKQTLLYLLIDNKIDYENNCYCFLEDLSEVEEPIIKE